MMKYESPNNLWSDFFELESYILSNTAHYIFIFNGEVTETILAGEKSDISKFFEF